MPRFDQAFWEQLWAKTLREHPDKVARRPPNAQLMAELSELAPGRALDAGCGHGAEPRSTRRTGSYSSPRSGLGASSVP
ncbi:MAG TPA: hypothetical protein VHM25_11480, partial [Polyangiaceae bacterium]|nr:hypothetical protein [Polyangiaceae bacterium]